MPRFSERIGAKPPKTVLQLDSMDDDLRNGLWNVCYAYQLKELVTQYFQPRSDYFCESLWRDFFKLPVDQMSPDGYTVLEFTRQFYFAASWHEAYDFVE